MAHIVDESHEIEHLLADPKGEHISGQLEDHEGLHPLENPEQAQNTRFDPAEVWQFQS
jgi:hypothetical protein